MNALRTIVSELAGLFVEDRFFALAIALWLALAIGALVSGIVPPPWRGPALFTGLAIILVTSVMRAARRPRL